MPSKHLLVSSYIHILKYTAPAIQAETLQYLHSCAATPRTAVGTCATAVGKAMAWRDEQGATALPLQETLSHRSSKIKEKLGFFHTVCNCTEEMLVVAKST